MRAEMDGSPEPAVPRDEILGRAARLWGHLRERDVAAFLAVQRVEVLYFAGTPQDGIVWMPRDGEPLFLVRRDLERARRESPLARIVPFARPSGIPETLAAEGVRIEGPVAASLDVLPVRLYESLRRALGLPIEDASREVRLVRAVKTPFERARIREAGALAERTFAFVREHVRPGMRELDLAAEIGAFLVRAGSVTLYRTRAFNLEFSTACCLGGPSGDWRGAPDSPNGAGRGPHPAFGQGASDRPLRPGEPILVDLPVPWAGYYADTTRLFHWGDLPSRFVEAHRLAETILEEAVRALEAGRPLEAVYEAARARADAAGLGEAFMGGSRFLGHGVGLEIDEWPVVAEGFDAPLEEGAVVSLEPKFALPGGIVGVETTYIFEGRRMRPVVDLPTAPVRLD